jgi:Ser-tRNA(Ala) deacylase AlaX
MAQRATLVQEGLQRVRTAAEILDHRFRRLQKRLDAERKSFEKRIESQRKAIERRTQRQLERLLARLRESKLAHRAETLREDAAQRLETGASALLGALQIASKGDLDRIDRKLSQLTRKLKDIEKNGAAA